MRKAIDTAFIIKLGNICIHTEYYRWVLLLYTRLITILMDFLKKKEDNILPVKLYWRYSEWG